VWNDKTVVPIDTLEASLQLAVAKMEAELDVEEEVAGIATKDFTFIKNVELRQILERDYIEVQKALISQSWKSAIILAGSSLEAILLDLLTQKETQARSAKKAKAGSIDRWDLVDLINVAVELQLISDGASRLSDPVRQYRNLVHPGNEIRQRLKIGKEEATIAFNILELVCRDLS
jgi:hypothetical protein